MPIGTALHERVMQLCESLNFRDWAGYYAASVYETHHDHEYNAIRNAAAMIDVSPLFKYRISGPDAARFINRVIARDIERVAVGQAIYCCWCDEQGKVIDDGTISRLAENQYRWTAAEPNFRWFHQNSLGLDVKIEDISRDLAALAIQGPTSSRLLQSVVGSEIANLKYFRVTRGRIAAVDVEISRTGYTGDLGYEIWIPWNDAPKVWDALVQAGGPFDLHPAGMLALDVARIEAGLILIDVDYTSSKKALIESQKYSPYEIGLGRLVDLRKEKFIGREALAEENRRGPKRSLVGLELNWDDVERLYDAAGLAPQVSSTASRIAVPVYRSGEQIGKATSTTWSPA
ncbi:MAG TPA: aminomethyltransferase family protein, partial [Candidatus Acidoferrales bacterium]|nr:aminomethyltransferase family protein [Candidatus Acidoferrales bacterium]